MIKGRSRSVLPVQFCLGEIMRLRNIWVSTLVLTLAASVIACGGDVKGVVTLDATAPTNQAIKMNADPVCLKEAKGPQAQETYTVGSDGKSLGNVFVYVKDGLGSYTFDPPTDKAKIDHKECRYRQQRPDAAQHPRVAEGQQGIQHRPANPGDEDSAHLHGQGSDGSVQVRRPRLDERLRRCSRPPVFRNNRLVRQIRAEGASTRHLHNRGVAREARADDAEREARCEGIEGPEFPVQSARRRHVDGLSQGWIGGRGWRGAGGLNLLGCHPARPALPASP